MMLVPAILENVGHHKISGLYLLFEIKCLSNLQTLRPNQITYVQKKEFKIFQPKYFNNSLALDIKIQERPEHI